MLTYSSAAEAPRERRRLTSAQIIILGFSGVILLGALLLTLPLSSRGGDVTPFGDALFTAVSAVCVTGLVVRDTAAYWSAFGQGIILLLIQVGGMGVITVAASFTVFSGKKISLMQRSTMQEAISAPNLGGIVRLTGFAVRTTLLLELLGAAAMAPVFCRGFGVRGLWMALFHSVSAFCNAGFDLMGVREEFSSLTYYAAQPVINVTVMPLIITGGMGFLTWDDLRANRWHWHRYRMQTKVILSATAALLILPAATFRRREHAALFQRRLDGEVVKHAATIFLMYIVLFFGGALAISMAEGLPMYPCLFETASAIGTVGLTLGLTPGLGPPSRLILTGLMFFGRVGGLTLIFAALSGAKKTGSKLPQEKITVG